MVELALHRHPAVSAIFGLPLHGGYFDSMSLHLWGAAANFLLSSVVVLVFSTRLAAALRERENQLAMLRERFVRNEGIVALATHAASVAHELNTPLATMTLLTDDIAEQCIDNPEMHDDLETLRELLVQCRERVLALAAPASFFSAAVASQAEGTGAAALVSASHFFRKLVLAAPASFFSVA